MKKLNYIFAILISVSLYGQTDIQSQWRDMYSYNTVKDFLLKEDKLIAIVDNAMFITDINDNISQKFSTVDGLSGFKTSSLAFDNVSDYTLIGYENGFIEIISPDMDIIPITGIRDNIILVDKEVKGFFLEDNYEYAYGDFGIIELNLERTEFIEWYKLSNNNVQISVNKILILNDILYAATKVGLYSIDLNLGLGIENIENWTQIKTGEITDLIISSSKVYFVQGNNVFNVIDPNISLINTPSKIESVSLGDTDSTLLVVMSSLVQLHNLETFSIINEKDLTDASSHIFTTEKGILDKGYLYLQTEKSGVLRTKFLEDNNEYDEFHPVGPSGNDIFSITVKNENIWVSYGGYTGNSNFSLKNRGVSGFYNGIWYDIPFSELNARDITKIEIDPNDPSKIYIASYFNGVVLAEFQQNENTNTGDWKRIGVWNSSTTNGGITKPVVFEGVTSFLSIDKNENMWITSLFSQNNEFMSKYNFSTEEWETKVNFSSAFGLSAFEDIRILNNFTSDDGNIFCGTNRNGFVVFKDSYDINLGENNKNNEIELFSTDDSSGALTSNNVRAIVTDENNRIWIGTDNGLVVYTYDKIEKELGDREGLEYLYDNDTRKPASTIIFEENGEAKELLGNTKVNDIIIDLAGNKWFGTDGAGLFQTSSDGQTTYNTFETSNSPLPSNTILDLELDKDTGEIYIVTEKGTLVYDSKNEPFGTSITDVVAYPNPAIRNQAGHGNITIVAKDGNGIPDGTNVKIIDVSGKLVYETNINSFNGNLGGKVVWDKRNLKGNNVVSGVYIVLLSNSDGSETTTTKIAIVN